MEIFLSIHWLLIAAIWYGINGVLHDFFVLKKHEGEYDRELLRLLMDGYVLLLSSAVLLVGWFLLRSGSHWYHCIYWHACILCNDISLS